MSKRKKSDLFNQRIRIHENQDDVYEYQEQERKRDKTLSPLVIMALILSGVTLFSMFGVVHFNRVTFSLAWYLKYAGMNVKHLYNLVFQAGDTGNIEVTLFKIMAVAVIGAALATCGTVMQGCFRNVMAGPSTTGVMAGGTLGCTLYLILFSSADGGSPIIRLGEAGSTSFFASYAYQFCVLAGCIGGVALILTISTIAGKGKLSAYAMLISGMVFSTLISNVNMMIQYYMIMKNPEDERITAIRDMMMGSFDRINNPTVLLMMGLPILICLGILLRIRNRLNLLSMGMDEAAVAGMNVQRYQRLMMFMSALITALVVSFCGQVGFIGFMVPLIARRAVGPDMRALVPASMLAGAILLLVIQDISVFLGVQDSINLVTSGLGCIMMLITLIGGKGGKRNAFNQGRGMAGVGFR